VIGVYWQRHMRIGLVGLVAVAATAFASTKGSAQTRLPADQSPAGIQMGVSTNLIPVGSDFAGTQIAVFGTIENPDKFAQVLNEYSIVVTVTGPIDDIVVRRKARVFGVWMNRESRVYRAVPSFYALASNRALPAIADDTVLKENRIGIDNLPLNLLSSGTQTFISPQPEFASSLRRLRREDNLFTEDPTGVVFLGSSLFRATLPIPSNAPIGQYTVSAYLFREGSLIADRSDNFRIERAGFESMMFTLAHVYSYWYGVIAVLAALATGWLASIIFGRN
jgi:uncharacterized protein (TIGR02186 family)